MSNSSGPGCCSESHHVSRWDIYDSLPREIRGERKTTPSNLYAGCVRITHRRTELQQTVAHLSRRRRLQKEHHGREVVYRLEPEGTGL